MTPQERAQVHRILDTLDTAIGAFQESRAAFATAIAALGQANDAQSEALAGISAAMKAAIRLLSEEE